MAQDGPKTHLGPSWRHPGRILGHLGREDGPAWALLGRSLGHVVAILGRLGAILEHLGAVLGYLRRAWGIFA